MTAGFPEFPELGKAGNHWDPSNYWGICVISTLCTMCCSIRNARLLNFPNQSSSLRSCCLKTQNDSCHHVQSSADWRVFFPLLWHFHLNPRRVYALSLFCFINSYRPFTQVKRSPNEIEKWHWCRERVVEEWGYRRTLFFKFIHLKAHILCIFLNSLGDRLSLLINKAITQTQTRSEHTGSMSLFTCLVLVPACL